LFGNCTYECKMSNTRVRKTPNIKLIIKFFFLFSFVLDGFPLTKKHVELLTEKGIIPYKLFELECDLTECTIRAMKDRSDPR